MTSVEAASDEDKTILIDAVIRAVCRECTSRVKIERKVTFKCKALEAFGRVDVLRHGEFEKAVVMECNKNDFDKDGLAGAAFTRDPKMNEHIYGVVSDFLTWQVMELGTEEARFCKLCVNESKREDGLRAVLGVLAALLQGKEARDV
ncbi:Crinkler (CRN) domain containing hypothetical protein [Phytophthora palmivora]|uniref:Uncharacterized protein n=1 Tax=Phytophthora palmivora TaxID=4796 RepID=A0A2P4YNN2_9STRA|nr:Crinkler (CRN) domain containing hypothetical protein [Phytophthora palmivora]